MPKVNSFQLANGLRIVHLQTNSKLISCGLHINVGARDELANEHGLAHLLEHCLFKGTNKRTALQINNRLDSVGGELNAYTSKEETCIYANSLASDFDRATELIADICFNAKFPSTEIEKEKEVVCEEIDYYKDTPSELIGDEFEDLLFAQSDLGHNILGKPKQIKAYTPAAILAFMKRNYTCNQMVFAAVGKISETQFIRVINKYLLKQVSITQNLDRIQAPLQKPFALTKKKNTHQCHVVIGSRAYPYTHPKRMALNLLINYIGGGASNALLNLVLREKAGLVYTVEASYTSYSDTGVVMIYFACSKQNCEKSLQLVYAELTKLQTQILTPIQLHRIKKQFICQYTIASESSEQQMLQLAKDTLYHLNSYTDIYNQVENISAKDLQTIARELFAPNQLSQLIYD